MKKKLLICTATLFLTACADKEQYQQAVLTQIQSDKELKDYNIDSEEMTQCVVDVSSKDMPGSFAVDPARLTAYQNYAKMVSMSTVVDKKAMLEELRTIFGSPQALAAAHRNYSKSYIECMASINTMSEPELKEAEVEAEAENNTLTN